MQSLAETLYDYAQTHRVAKYLQVREYRQPIFGLEQDWEDFRTALTAEQRRRLEELLERQFKAGSQEDKASFLAGLSVGLELARL